MTCPVHVHVHSVYIFEHTAPSVDTYMSYTCTFILYTMYMYVTTTSGSPSQYSEAGYLLGRVPE